MLEHLVDTVLYLEETKGMIIVSYDPPKIDLEQLMKLAYFKWMRQV